MVLCYTCHINDGGEHPPKFTVMRMTACKASAGAGRRAAPHTGDIKISHQTTALCWSSVHMEQGAAQRARGSTVYKQHTVLHLYFWV